jgi:asparagine synthase (glutamine-hydrolysing)
MCGISLAVNRVGKPVGRGLIQGMTDKIAHRGPDDQGFYFGENFAFGHRRLSIIDLTQGGHQPMQRGSLCIIYNGEIYNYVELRKELEVAGQRFTSASDTEVILAAYEQWGSNAFAKFNGMWAFAIHDAVKNEIVLSRDHFGIKPLYYTQAGPWFLAGSEIKQFMDVEDFIPTLNKKVAVNFLVNGALNYSTDTFFEGVSELRAGHWLRYDLASHVLTIEKWYDLNKSSVKVNDDFEMASGEIRRLFLDSVRIRMRSDVRVGSCLSGGVDSSSIVSVIGGHTMANSDFATITSCYSDKRYDEQIHSDEVSAQTGFKAIKVYPDLNDLVAKGDLDKMIYHQEQPFGSASHYSEFKVFQAASVNKMIVMQDGQGADEYLCGYGEFFEMRLRELFAAMKWKAAITLLRARAAHKGTQWVHELRAFMESAYVSNLRKFTKKVLGWNKHSWIAGESESFVGKSLESWRVSSIRELSLLEMERTSIPYQLHSEDRNSMHFSIESRLPFLDHRLVEYAIGLPSSFKIRHGFSKAVLRNAVTELPDKIRNRRDKMGFVAPDAIWILENKEMVRKDLVEAVKNISLFSESLLLNFDLFCEGKRDYELIYFRAMTFNRFCRMYKLNWA